MEEEIDYQRIEIIVGFVILGLLILLVVSALVVKVLYDKNNHYMMTMLPDAERKIYAAIQCFEREQDRRSQAHEELTNKIKQ
jgi:hypothetical protein